MTMIRKIFRNFYKESKKWIFIVAGVLSAGMGLKGFLLPNEFLDGGAMGISLLISTLTGFELSILVVLVNLPFVLLGMKQISKIFVLRTIIAVSLLALALAIVPYPVVTTDKLLVSVFGGFFLGVGIGMTIRGDAVIDGTEVLALFFSKKLSVRVGDVIAIINIIIFMVAMLLINVEIALYAILTYISASKTVDFVLHGLEEDVAVMVISDKYDEIRKFIIEEMRMGVTILKGSSGLNSDSGPKDVIYTVISRLEVGKLISKIEAIDELAFIIQHRVDDTRGGMIRRKLRHKHL